MKYYDPETTGTFVMQFGHGMSERKNIYTKGNIIIQTKEQKLTEIKE